MVKKKYQGRFLLNREMFIEYVWAHTERQAAVQMMRRIAKKQGVIPSWTVNFFIEHPQNYTVEESKELL